MKMALRFLFLGVVVFSLSVCNQHARIDTYPGLANKGILPLSSTNAYQGANLFLAKELERSSYLFNFLKTRGAPNAIEIRDRGFEVPQLYLYYGESNTVFIGELRADKRNRQWIMRGPHGINRLDFRTVRQMTRGIKGPPVFELHGNTYRFTPTEELKVAKKLEPEIPFIAPPTPTPTPTPYPIAGMQSDEPEEPKGPQYDQIDFIPQNLDQVAIMMSMGFARKDKNGDILHTVERSGETIEAITAWYTGDAKNVEQVIRRNGLTKKNAKKLAIGAVIRVPQELLTRVQQMPLEPFKE